MRYFVLVLICFAITGAKISAQKTYSISVTEFIFSFSDSEFTEDFRTQYPGVEAVKNNMRFTAFFHFGQDWHLDFTNNIGIITGLGVRNVGLISDEVLPGSEPGITRVNYKIVRRLYTLGVPLSLKLGSFKDHLFFCGGGELELALHYKEKYWSGSHNRSGNKTVYTTWFGEQTPLLIPSLFGGVQFPKGINIKVKYYLNDFLNHKYERGRNTGVFNISDLTRYETSQVFYISLSIQFNTAYIADKNWNPKKETVASKSELY